MAIAQLNLADVTLKSNWQCYYTGTGFASTYPTTAQNTQAVNLAGIPAGSTINSAVLNYTISGSPNTGAAMCTINGAAAPWREGAQSVPLQVTGGEYSITFAFRANGSTHEHSYSHSAVLSFQQITLVIDYADPYAPSDWTINTPSVDAGNPVSVTVTPKGGGYTHLLKAEFGAHTAQVDMAEGVSVASLPTSLTWLTAIPNTVSGVANLTLYTYRGGTLIGSSSKSVTITAPASVVPSLEASVARVLTVGGMTYPDVTGGYVQQKSAVKATITSAAGAYGSTITGYSINVGGKSDAAFNTAGTSLTTPLLPDAGTVVITFRATDSRGRTAQKLLTIQVEAYAPPRANKFTVYRANEQGQRDDNGTRGRYEFQKVFSSLGGKNTCTASIAAAGSEASGIGETGWIVPGAVKTLDTLLSYDVYLTLEDAYGSVTVSDLIPSINFALHFSADGTSTWVGGVSEHSNAFGVAPGRTVYFYGQELRDLIRSIISETK
jgi:hypothetical protein